MAMQTSAAGIEFGKDGEVVVGPEFRALEAAWIAGIAAMANAEALECAQTIAARLR